jgi:hypothetical protein
VDGRLLTALACADGMHALPRVIFRPVFASVNHLRSNTYFQKWLYAVMQFMQLKDKRGSVLSISPIVSPLAKSHKKIRLLLAPCRCATNGQETTYKNRPG